MSFSNTPFNPASPPGLTPDQEFFPSPATPQYALTEQLGWPAGDAFNNTDLVHFQNDVLTPGETGEYDKVLSQNHTEQAYTESQAKHQEDAFSSSRAAVARSGLPQLKLNTTWTPPQFWVPQAWSPTSQSFSVPPKMKGGNVMPTPHSQQYLAPPNSAPVYTFPPQLSASPASTTRFRFDDYVAQSPYCESGFQQADLPAMDGLALSPVSYIAPEVIFSPTPWPEPTNESDPIHDEPAPTPHAKPVKTVPSSVVRMDRFIKRNKRERATAATAKATCEECGEHFKTKYSLSQHKQRKHGTPKDKIFVCIYDPCTTRFARRNDLARHVNSIHEKIEEHSCPLCDKIFARKDGMIRHYDRSCRHRQRVTRRTPKILSKL